MNYRQIVGTDINLSTIGIGASHLHDFNQEQTNELIEYALTQGINFIDLALAYPEPLDMLGNALKGRRDKFYLQIQIGMTFPKGQYTLTRDPEKVKDGLRSSCRSLEPIMLILG